MDKAGEGVLALGISNSRICRTLPLPHGSWEVLCVYGNMPEAPFSRNTSREMLLFRAPCAERAISWNCRRLLPTPASAGEGLNMAYTQFRWLYTAARVTTYKGSI